MMNQSKLIMEVWRPVGVFCRSASEPGADPEIVSLAAPVGR